VFHSHSEFITPKTELYIALYVSSDQANRLQYLNLWQKKIKKQQNTPK